MCDYPCPACGFMVFDESSGSYDICEVCGWEDDDIQLQYPSMRGGANRESLSEHQAVCLIRLPQGVKKTKAGYRQKVYFRDPSWRPLLESECTNTDETHYTKSKCIETIGKQEALYFWRRKV
jgi:hypothetical protein